MDSVDKVEMSLPAKKEYARILRLAAAGIASRMNFTVDGLEDLKIGLEEAYVLAVNDEAIDRFDVVFEIYEDRLEMVVAGLGIIETFEERLSNKFGFSILDSVMDKVEWTSLEGSRQLRLIIQIR